MTMEPKPRSKKRKTSKPTDTDYVPVLNHTMITVAETLLNPPRLCKGFATLYANHAWTSCCPFPTAEMVETWNMMKESWSIQPWLPANTSVKRLCLVSYWWISRVLPLMQVHPLWNLAMEMFNEFMHTGPHIRWGWKLFGVCALEYYTSRRYPIFVQCRPSIPQSILDPNIPASTRWSVVSKGHVHPNCKHSRVFQWKIRGFKQTKCNSYKADLFHPEVPKLEVLKAHTDEFPNVYYLGRIMPVESAFLHTKHQQLDTMLKEEVPQVLHDHVWKYMSPIPPDVYKQFASH